MVTICFMDNWLLIQVIILLSTGGKTGGGYESSKYSVIAFHGGILLLHAITNSLPISWLSFFGQLAAAWNIVGVFVLIILIPSVATERASVKYVFTHFNTDNEQVSSHFSLIDVQEMDAIVSSFNAFETKEAGPLILTWAVFLCLISSLLGKEENNVLLEIDHISYVRQAFEAASLRFFLEILESDLLNESDESLCSQFWDRESFVDGLIRCLLCSLEGEFPFRTVELIRLLSSLFEETWPAECVQVSLFLCIGLRILQ
ncbi:uncharacterized protein LOC133818354 isoform X8 [Humulus lupulus]|nr:uncharacterized protein LOC133818354 isoform X8 [Humulus lupulus]XP_062107181.1 uncharacterized protein LOC133818354 isoform X8 [Humulus lupulus]XP_062107182.1 uncharacterized protein LOC133818354 isoform X8 [Humulus lupulus]